MPPIIKKVLKIFRCIFVSLISALVATVVYMAVPDLFCSGYVESGPGGGAAVGMFAIFIIFPAALSLSLAIEISRGNKKNYLLISLFLPPVLAAMASLLMFGIPVCT